MHRVPPRARLLAIILTLAVMSLMPLTVAAYDWPTFSGASRYQGDNDRETVLTTANVGGLHPLFQVTLPAIADGVPVFLGGVETPTGPRDLLFVTTRTGQIVALDAHDGTQLWQQEYGPGDCTINGGASACYTTSSPAIDPDKRFVYSYGLDGYVHKYAVGDGTESTDGGWPELVTRKGYDEKGSSALNIATARNGASYLYVAHAGYPGDRGDYQGHLTTINLADGTQHVFNAACSDQADIHFFPSGQGQDCEAAQTAIWVRQAVVYDPDTDKMYTVTGNGMFDGAHNWGESVIALNPDGTGANGGPLDSYTPTNFEALTSRDADLGSTAPVILPMLPESAIPHLAVQGGKDAKLRLLNLDNLSGQGGPGHTGGEIGPLVDVPQGGQVLTAPAVWINPADSSVSVIITNGSGVSALHVVTGDDVTPGLRPLWQNPNGGTTPIVANGVIYYAGSGTLHALDAATGNELWHDTIGSIHWESPIVANSVVYITDGNSHLTAYGA
jgi:outer membrane protein assembly factor BamB